MSRILLGFLLISVVPLRAQSPEPVTLLRSGSTVRLILHSGPPTGSTGAILGMSGDTLRVATPEFGLAELPLAAVRRLEVPAPTARRAHTAGGAVLAISAGAGILSMLEGEGFIATFLGSTLMLTSIALPGYASEPRQWRPVVGDSSSGLTGLDRQDEPLGARVRVSAPGQGFRAAKLRLQDFRADTVYFTQAGELTPLRLPVGEITSLELSIGRNTGHGTVLGRNVGAIVGGLYGAALFARQGGYVVLLAPVGAGIGIGLGGGIGAVAGYLLAPREWVNVPVTSRIVSSQ